MNSEILRIIEGGLTNDKRKIISYSTKLAERLSSEGDEMLAKCIMQKINSTVPQSSAVADAVRTIPLDSDSRLQIVEVIPPEDCVENIVLSDSVERKVDEFISIVNHRSDIEIAGLDVKKTLLLYGEPGCGKTSIAHYIAQKTELPLVVARLDGIVSSLLGSTAKNIRKIFEYAQSIPCILFLDEFDAIAKARDDQHEMGELKRVINSLLQNIDSMKNDCTLIAATNHPEMLDKAVWRRFVQTIEVGRPDKSQILEMIDIFSEPFNTDYLNDLQKKNLLAEAVSGMSPSDIRTVFDKSKVKCVIDGTKLLSIDKLLSDIYDIVVKQKTEENYVKFLSNHGVTQIGINQYSGISLRKIKAYLADNK